MDADDLSDRDLETWTGVRAVPDVTVFLVSPSSVVTQCFVDVSWDMDWELVEPQSSSFSKRRAHRAPPFSRRRTMSPTPEQSSHLSIEDRQWQIEVEDKI